MPGHSINAAASFGRSARPQPAAKKSAAGVFEGGGAASEDTASAAQVDLLYRQIGQLKVENDFLVRKLGK